MALVRGGGGNISPANVAGLGHSAEIEAWEAEQERKKRAAQNLTMSIAKFAPVQLTEQAPSHTFKEKAATAQQSIMAIKQPGTLDGYWKQVAARGGQRQVGQRAQVIKNLWDTYLSPYDGSKAIAGLLTSPYATDEIEVMMKAANRAMFSGGGVNPLKIPPELVRKLGLDPSNPAHTAAAGLRVANGGFLSAPATTRNAVTASKQNGLLNRVWNFMAEGTKELVANTYHDLIEPVMAWGSPEVKDIGEYTEEEWKELQQGGAGKLLLEEALSHKDLKSRLTREEIDEVLAQPWDSAAAQNFMQYRKASEAAMAEATGLAAGVGLLALPGGAAAVEGIVGRIFANPYTRAMAQHGTKFGVEAFRADVVHDVLTGANQQWGGGNEVVQGVVDAASGFLMARGGYNMLKGVSGTVGAAAAGGGKVAGLTYAGVKGTAGLAGLNALAAGADAFVQAADAPGQIEYNAKAQEAFENPMAAGGAEAQLASLMALIDTADVQTAQEIWAWTQTDQTIGEGDEQQVLIPGYGQNIPWSGGFTWEMKQAVADKFAAEKRFNIENQIMLQKSGFADLDLELDGVLGENATDDWKLAMDRALAAEDKNLSFSTDHPEWGKVLGMMGMPVSKEGWLAKERLLLNHGPLQAVASNLVLMPVNALGGLYNGTLAACTYGTSMLTDGVYNRLKKEYQEAVASEAPDVEEKKQAALQRKAWLLQNTFIPDAIMPVSELFGKDVDEAVEWHKNHPEVSLLADITRDALVAFATPAATRFVKEQFFPAREFNSALGNPLMKHRMSVVLKEVMREGGRGLEFAKEAVGRTADGEALVRTIEQLYQGKTARKAWEPLAKEMVDAADSGNIERIMELTTLDQAGAQALANKLRTVTGPTGAVDPVAARIKKAGNVLAAEQRGSHGLLNMAAIALETGSRAWADGKSIFPDWASPLVPKRSSAHRLIVNSIDNIKHDGAREFATSLLAPWEVKGTRTIDVGNNLANSHRVFYSALTATGDISSALELASRWIRNPDPKARFAVGDRTATALEHRYDVAPSVKMDEHNVEVGVNPITGEKLGEGLPALPTYLRYTADFGAQSRALNAQYSKAIIEEWGGVRGFVAKYMANPVRFVEGYPKFGLQDASAYLRHLTVATGPLLATKHLFADTSRTLLASPYAIIDSRGQAEGFAQRVRDVAATDNQVAKNVLYQKSMMESSLAHYYGHKADVPMGDFHSFQIYEPDAGGNVVAVKGRVESGAEALRRIANDPVTRAWAEGMLKTWQESGLPAYTYKPVSDAAAHVWYHGTSRKVENLGGNLWDYARGPESAYGPGLYLTDNPGVAVAYAGKVKNWYDSKVSGSKVFEARVGSLKVLDLEQAAPVPVASSLRSLVDGITEVDIPAKSHAIAALDSGAPLKDFYRGLREDLSGNEYWAVNDIINSVQDAISASGYNALSHTGGIASGSNPHNVLILLEPTGERGGAAQLASASEYKIPAPIDRNGGWDSVREWLKGADGRQFLNRSSIAIRYLEANKGAKQSDLIDYYIDTYAEPLLEGLNQTAPQITDGLRDMALGNRLASSAEAKKLLQEVNGDGVIENPYLSIADHESSPWWQHSISAFMTPNRVNRALLFNRVFNKSYDSMLKEGVEKPQAATVAMDLARLTTERIHFDLANALNIEARRRYAAWFATKHRLYDTWILREMLQRPSIAGAAQTLLNFLETKNEGDDTIKEWDKEKWAIDIDKYMPGLNKLLGPVLGSPEGNKMLIDPRTLYWLYESNWESSVGQIEESALAWIIETATGANMPPMQSTFGVMSTGRTDRVVGSLAISLPIFLAASKGELNDEWLKKYLDGDVDDLGMVSQMGLFAGNTWLGRPAMEQLRKSIDYQLATAHHKGVELQPYEAAVMAAYQGIGYEFMQVGKIWPGRIQLGTATKMDTLMQQWTELDPDARIQFMDEHPEIRYMFGIYSTNPVDQHSIVKGFTDVAKIQRERGNAFANAVDNGSIWNYETVMGINALYDDMIEQVTNRDWLDPDTGEGSSLRNDTFSDFLNTLGQGDLSFSEILQAMFPIMDVKVVNQQSYIPNEYQQRMKKTELNEAFESVLERALQPDAEGNFYDVTNPNDPYRIWLEYDNITAPFNAFMKYQDPAGWATGYQKQVFDELAQTANGVTLSAKYFTYAHRQYLMAELVKGASGYAKTGVAGLPMFATMTTEAKERIGRTSTKAAENIWREYCARYSQAKAVLRQNGVSESSDLGKALMKEVTQWAEQQASQPGNEVFADEWSWCKKPIEERLVDIGITEAGQPNSPFWGEFLNLVGAYKQGLSILDVGPTAQKAYPVHELFWPELDELRKKYPAGWNQLIEVFGGLSKFGFSKWRPPEGQFSQLFLGTVDEGAYESAFEGGSN